jgi:hypothetical protein
MSKYNSIALALADKPNRVGLILCTGDCDTFFFLHKGTDATEGSIAGASCVAAGKKEKKDFSIFFLHIALVPTMIRFVR